jgi:transcription initiation factor TFIID TATA-box-binding protein
LFTGAGSTDSIVEAYENVREELVDAGLESIKSAEEIEIQNIVSTLKLENGIDLNHLVIDLGIENVEYEPEVFPGLVYKTEDGPVALIFSSGKVVITGAVSTEEILSAAEKIRELIDN